MGESFPIYILKLGRRIEVVFPEGKGDLSHSDFWEQTASFIVARHFKIPQPKLANLVFSQRRARVVPRANRVYYGEKPIPALLAKIRRALENDELEFVHDDHEKRLKYDVRQFHRLTDMPPQLQHRLSQGHPPQSLLRESVQHTHHPP